MGKHEAEPNLGEDTEPDIGAMLRDECEAVEAGRLVPEAVAEESVKVANYWRHIASVQLTDLQMTRRHLDYAHAAICRARQELRTLNEVILRRKRVAKRQRRFLDAVNELHRPVDGRDLDNTTCREDGQSWPCRTHHALETVTMEAIRAARKAGTVQ